MKHLFTSSLSKNVLSKLALSLALILMGTSPALADDYTETLTFENGTLPSGWQNGGTSGDYSVFTLNDGYIATSNNYGTFSLTSKSTTLTINSGQKIIIKAKVNTGYASTYQKVTIRYSYDKGSNFTELKKFDNSNYSSQSEYTDLELLVPHNIENCQLQFLAQATTISRIEIKAAPELLTTIDEDVDPGVFKTGKTNVTVKYTAVSGWNSICVPIQLRTWSSNHLNSIFGTGFKAYTLSSYADGTLTFAPIAASGYVQANTPLVVYAPNASGSQSNLVLDNIDVTYSSNPSATAGGAVFQGTYAPIAAGAMTGNYGLTPSGQIRRAGSGASLKGYRAYFTGISAPSGVKMIVIEEDGGETDLGIVKMVDEKANDVYTLAGQKVQKGRKGIYIVNGKKVVIK